MSVRICPRCSTPIESATAVFCYHCGQELAELAFVEERSSPASTSTRRLAPPNKSLIFSLVLLFWLILVLSGAIFWSAQGRFEPKLKKPVGGAFSSLDQKSFVATFSALPIAPANFDLLSYAALAPATSDLFLTGFGLKYFLTQLLSREQVKTTEALVGLNTDEIVSFFENNFAHLRQASRSALLLTGKDPEFIKSRLAKIPTSFGRSFVFSAQVILSDDETFLKEIKATADGTNLSLAQTARFQEAVKDLPRQGQFFILGRLPADLFVPLEIYFGPSVFDSVKTLKGLALVVSAQGGNAVFFLKHE